MEKIKVLATGTNLRERSREIFLNAPEGMEFKTLQDLGDMPPDYEISKNSKKTNGALRSFARFLIKKLNIPNIRYLPKKYLKDFDFVYTPAQMLLNKKPYVIEVENVAALGFYNLKTIYKRRELIKRFLKSSWCKFLISFSEAGRLSVVNTFKDDEITAKMRVIYPYVKINTYPKKPSDKIVILSSNTKFFMKGTREILLAYEELRKKYNNLELWIISNTPAEYLEKYRDFFDIKFFPAKFTKDDLYRDFYSQCDIFVQPSYQDTLGITYLEVAASGKPIISTDIMGLPEVVVDGYNGFLIKAPFYMHNSDFTLKSEYFPMPVIDTENDFYKKVDGRKVAIDLIEKISILIENNDLRKKMGEHSLELIKTKFSEKKRKQQLLEVFQKLT